MPIWYVFGSSGPFPITREEIRPLLAYVSTGGQPQDWMYDGLLVYSFDFMYTRNPTTATVDVYAKALFDDGQLQILNDAVAELKAQFHDGDYRLKVYLTAPYTQGADAISNTSKLLDRYTASSFPDLELVGFYWGYDESDQHSGAPSRMSATGAWVRSQGLELVWIPYPGGMPSNTWEQDGLDEVSLQPHFAFQDQATTALFATADDHIYSWNLAGAELEFGKPRNNIYPVATQELQNALAYIQASNQYNWMQRRWSTYYWGRLIGGYANDTGDLRPIYDRLFRITAARPRKSVALRVPIVASADADVEEAGDRKNMNFGTNASLNLGSNAYPNASRVLLNFPLGAVPAAQPLLAAHIHLQEKAFPYGTIIDDVRVYEVDASAWEESTVTAANAPPQGAASAYAPYRLRDWAHYPFQYSFDVTEIVHAALAAGKPAVSFVIRRATEDGTLHEASFHSRESGDATAPRLDLVFPCGLDVGTDAGTDSGVADGFTPDATPDATPDVTPLDAAQPDGPPRDTSTQDDDAGRGPEASGGCDCGAAHRSASGGLQAWMLSWAAIGLIGLGRRRRRKSGSGHS